MDERLALAIVAIDRELAARSGVGVIFSPDLFRALAKAGLVGQKRSPEMAAIWPDPVWTYRDRYAQVDAWFEGYTFKIAGGNIISA